MNKTIKTIAWICLVLGLLGLAVDVGVYVHGRTLIAQHQAAIEAGELPVSRGFAGDIDKDGDHDQDGWFPRGETMDGRRRFNTFSNNRGGFPGGMRDGRIRSGGFILPFLFLASGPVLAVVGAVTLIVNRAPKDKESSEKKETIKKK